jgi:hypothetical protein
MERRGGGKKKKRRERWGEKRRMQVVQAGRAERRKQKVRVRKGGEGLTLLLFSANTTRATDPE